MRFLTRTIGVLAASAFATGAIAASPIDGTWKTDTASVKLPKRPDVVALRDGSYTCTSCIPAYTVPADGQFHKVPGHSYWDETSVTVVDPATVTYTYRQAGKLVTTSRDSVSADGATLTSSYEQTLTGNGTPVSGSETATRVAPAPAGAHAISGSWQRAAVGDMSDSGKAQTFLLEGRMLKMTTPTGESYAARLGGAFVPVLGDNGKTMVAVRQLNRNAFEETGKRDGKIVYVMTFIVQPDGRKLAITSQNMKTNTTTTMMADKQ